MANVNEADGEAWEDKLEENVCSPQVKPHLWDVLQKKVKDNLRKKSKILSLSQLNQLMILANFATLWLKGISHMNASVEIAQ